MTGDNLSATDRRMALVLALAASTLGGGALGANVGGGKEQTVQVAELAANVKHLSAAVTELRSEVRELRTGQGMRVATLVQP